jgi:DNA-binding transcriptional regulator of glucitol operon
MIWQIVVILCLAWALQAAFGYIQLRNFNSHYGYMRRRGRVVIGRCKGKISQGAVLLILIDNDCNILEAQRMKGITVLAKMKPLEILKNKNLLTIDQDILSKVDKITAKAIQDAVRNYNQFQNSKKEGKEE